MTTTTFALRGITSSTTYADGHLRECRVTEPNTISTPYGDLVPRFSDPDERTKDVTSISFHDNGTVRSITLEQQTPIDTPIGPLPAELVTFHEDGSLNSLFPLNGRIGASWTEEDEATLAEKFTFEFSFGLISSRIIGLRFYPGGEVRSLMLWPGEVVRVSTPLGVFPARTGIRLFPSGRLQSFEPAVPITLDTPVGEVLAYNVNALAVDTDGNSVEFDESGHLVRVVTSGDVIAVGASGMRRIRSRTQLALVSDVAVKQPMALSFTDSEMSVDTGDRTETIPLAGHRILVMPDIDLANAAFPTGCDSCSVGCS